MMKGCIQDIRCDRFSERGWERTSSPVPDEAEIILSVNRLHLVSVLCTPNRLNHLALGFLFAEGIISSVGDVASMRVCDDESQIDVRLTDTTYEPPVVRTLTSGCGGGTSFHAEGQKVTSNLAVTPDQVLALMKKFQKRMELYRLCGGVHASALADTGELVVVAEDIGRHNTLDKIQGQCLMEEIPTGDGILLSTGRVSSEMLLRAARMEVPIVVSRHSPTGRAVRLATDLDIALVGYARGSRLSVYSHSKRLGCPEG